MTAVRPSVLGDLRVLDLAGPIGWYGSRLMADLGADVLRIEPPGGDPLRTALAPAEAESRYAGSLRFWWYNLGKRALSLDLDSDDGRRTFKELAAEADVILESTPNGWLEERGLGYRELSRDNPGLIQTSVTPFGRTGPRAHWRGTDIHGFATSGVLNLAGPEYRAPSHPGGDQGYLHSGVVSMAATLVAIQGRRALGRGQQVDVSLQDSLVFANENNLGIVDLMGQSRMRMGWKFFGGDRLFFRAKDGWVVARIGGRWEPFVDWVLGLGLPLEHWRSPEWHEAKFREAHVPEFNEGMEILAAASTKESFTEGGQAHRAACSMVADVADLQRDVQLAARDFWVDVDMRLADGTVEPVRIQGAPFKLATTPWRAGAACEEPAANAGWLRSRSETPLPPPATGNPDDGPLSHVRVLDFTWVIAGPASTQVLADHGAEVLKIEAGFRPDSLRIQPLPRVPGYRGQNQSGIFSLINTSKRSVSIDLGTDQGKELIRRLISISDIVIDNYGVDPFPKWGLTRDEIRKIRPDIIIARSSVMGRSGPRQRYVGLGYTIGPAAGLNSLSGFPDDPPVGTCTAHPDYSSNPWHLLSATLSALHYRDETGIGQDIDLSQHESSVVFNGANIPNYTLNGVIPAPSENRHPLMAPHGVYPCRGDDRWAAIACETDDDWQRLARAIGRPDLAENETYATLAGRKANEGELDAAIADWTKLRHFDEAAEELQAAGVPATGVYTGVDVSRDAHLRARGKLGRVQHPELGWMTLNQPSFKLAETPGKIRRHPPLVGQDTDWVMNDILGMNEEEIALAYVESAVGV